MRHNTVTDLKACTCLSAQSCCCFKGVTALQRTHSSLPCTSSLIPLMAAQIRPFQTPHLASKSPLMTTLTPRTLAQNLHMEEALTLPTGGFTNTNTSC